MRKLMGSVWNGCKAVGGVVKKVVTDVRVWVGGGIATATTNAHALLTVDPATLTTGIESLFDAAALIGVSIAVVMFGVRFVKKGLRLA